MNRILTLIFLSAAFVWAQGPSGLFGVGAGSVSTLPEYEHAFSSTATVSIPGSTHGRGNDAEVTRCENNASPRASLAFTRTRDVSNGNLVITLTGGAATGTCRVASTSSANQIATTQQLAQKLDKPVGAAGVLFTDALGNVAPITTGDPGDCIKRDGSPGPCGTGTGGLPDPGANGIVKRTASGVTAPAIPGSDFAPATSGTAIQKANGSGGFSQAVPNTDYQAPLGFTPENAANKNANNGYAGLDSSGRLPISIFPLLLPLSLGGTNNATWIAGRCVQVSADGLKLEVAASACVGAGGLPSQTGNANKILVTDGTSAVWKALEGGGSNGITCNFSTTPATCDIVTTIVPRLSAANTWTGANDFSGAAWTKPAKTGTSAPATCAVGELFFDTDAPAGRNVYGCTAPNTWTLQGDGTETGGSGGSSMLLLGGIPTAAVGSSTTQYMSIFGFSPNGSENIRNAYLGRTGTLKNLHIRTTSVHPSTGDMVCTVRVNGANTSIVATIPANAAAGAYSDTTNTAALGATDTVSIGCANAATSAAANISSVVLTLEETGAGGSGNMTVTTVTGADPTGTGCTVGQTFWVRTDVTPSTFWRCAATNTARQILDTSGSGPYQITAACGSAPSAPATSGDITQWLDCTAKVLKSIHSDGTIGTMVRQVASRTANQFATHVDSSGIQHTAPIALADIPASMKIRPCELIWTGTGAAGVLEDTNDQAAVCTNDYGATLTITAVYCRAEGGTPTVRPAINGGASTSILSADLTCGNGTWSSAGTLNGTPTQSSGASIDDNIVTAGGAATKISIRIVRTL